MKYRLLWLLLCAGYACAQGQVFMYAGERREVDARYVDHYICKTGRMFIERHSRLDRRVTIYCIGS